MIHAILFLNQKDEARLSKWYCDYARSEQQQIESDLHALVTERDRKWIHTLHYKKLKVTYRRYASVIMCVLADMDDNEHCLFELIHLIIEILDEYFGNVCEMDIVTNFALYHSILSEVVLSGEIVEVSKELILQKLRLVHG